MTVGLNIQLEEDQGIVLVRIEGRLDAASAPLLEKKLFECVSTSFSTSSVTDALSFERHSRKDQDCLAEE